MKFFNSYYATGFRSLNKDNDRSFSQATGIEVLTSGTCLKHVAVNNDFHIFKFWQVKNSREKNAFFTLQNNST
jgi:hypothetical protein